jgi:hypothetical protein
VHGVQAVGQLVVVAGEQVAVAVQGEGDRVCSARTLTSFGLAPAAIHSATAVCVISSERVTPLYRTDSRA